jgi:hypothetical protein
MQAEHPYFRVLSQDFGGHGIKPLKKASQTYTIGGLVGFEIGVGTIRPFTAGDKLLGIVQESITSAHADYANTKPINVEIVFRGAEVHCPVSSGTVALTQIGDEADIVTGGLSVTLTESNNDFRMVKMNGAATDTVIATPQTTVY